MLRGRGRWTLLGVSAVWLVVGVWGSVENVDGGPALDWTNTTTWPVAAQYAFVAAKLCFAFSPILALVAVFVFAWESPEEERLKRNKKADFTFDSPE